MMPKNDDKMVDADARLNPGTSPSETYDNSPTSDPINEIFYNIIETRAELDKKHKKKIYYGLILDASVITARDCYIETSKTFLSTIEPDYFPKPEKKDESPIEDIWDVYAEELGVDELLKDLPENPSEKTKTPEEMIINLDGEIVSLVEFLKKQMNTVLID